MNRIVTGLALSQRTDDCAQCGVAISAADPIIERFGERFCSGAHAEQFAEGVRASRIVEVARREPSAAACQLPLGGPASWKERLKRSACWAAPLLVLLAIPLFWSGSALAAVGGSALSVLAALACPLGMYFMMRAMMPGHGDARSARTNTTTNTVKEDRHA